MPFNKNLRRGYCPVCAQRMLMPDALPTVLKVINAVVPVQWIRCGFCNWTGSRWGGRPLDRE
ncbi:MAG: hypothetical protein RBS10_03985 [Thauera propionica]|jgi:hypothetical protein|uniref:hypothetical protein n=1 Tax=Thauera TaxID=33057 RepID=UPI001056BBC7|nr:MULTISPECIES: hypothetical protein [Thauera]MDY0046557.1 hypothetical protein [Thauera propionica]